MCYNYDMSEKKITDKQKVVILKEIYIKTKKNYEILTKKEENRYAAGMLDTLNSL